MENYFYLSFLKVYLQQNLVFYEPKRTQHASARQ